MSDKRLGIYGLIVFDGSCGACSVFVGERRPFFEKHGFAVAPLQEEWVGDLTGIDQPTLSESIHLFTPSGEVYRGIAVFQRVAERVWWLLPFSYMLRFKPLRPLFEYGYKSIARRRRGISRACGLASRRWVK